jgi:competence protein ComFB
MALRDNYSFEYLVNDAERLVIDELERRLNADTEGTICRCQDCVLDMAAYALNSVRPAYRVSLLGKLYGEALSEAKFQEEVRHAVEKGIDVVRTNPSHD